MAHTRYCQRCGKDVECREVQREHALELYCPQCDHRLVTIYGHIVVQ